MCRTSSHARKRRASSRRACRALSRKPRPLRTAAIRRCHEPQVPPPCVDKPRDSVRESPVHRDEDGQRGADDRERAVQSPAPRNDVRPPSWPAAACRPAAECRAARRAGAGSRPPARSAAASGHGIATSISHGTTNGAASDDESDAAERATVTVFTRAWRDASADQAADAGAEQQREERDRERIHRMAEQQHELLEQRDLEQHEARTERAEVGEPRRPARARPVGADEQRPDDEDEDQSSRRCRTASAAR